MHYASQKETNMIRNLGQALSVVIAQEAAEADAHADVDAFGAPSECHSLVNKHMLRRRLNAIVEAQRIAGAPWAEITRQAAERGCAVYGPIWNRTVGNLIQEHLS
jgi:hypothetical protein